MTSQKALKSDTILGNATLVTPLAPSVVFDSKSASPKCSKSAEFDSKSVSKVPGRVKSHSESAAESESKRNSNSDSKNETVCLHSLCVSHGPAADIWLKDRYSGLPAVLAFARRPWLSQDGQSKEGLPAAPGDLYTIDICS